MKHTKLTDKTKLIVTISFLFSLGLSKKVSALGLNVKKFDTKTLHGEDPNNSKIKCHVKIGSLKRSPSHKSYRSIEFGMNRTTWNLSDFEPKSILPLLHYNQKGHYGYEIWTSSYSDQNHFIRIWMNYMVSYTTPHSVQLYAITKKTGITRFLGECRNFY